MTEGVSVVMAVRDGERFLTEALESVAAQSAPPDEIVVIDGGSRDASPRIAQAFPGVRWQAQRGQGVADAYNQGIAAARSPLLAFLSCDDRWLPEKLALQRACLAASAELQYCVGRLRYFLEPGCALPRDFRPALLQGEHVGFVMETLLARREVFDRVGGFRTDLATAEDVDWFARSRDLGVPCAVVPALLLSKRVHDRNLSLDAEANNRNLLQALRASLHRKREGGSG